jgi:polyisoprenoid-binding protein YceI
LSARTLFALTLAAAFIGAIAPPALAQPTAQLLSAQSEIVFTTQQMGVPVEGRFGKFSAQIALDPKQPATGRVAFTIDTGSARFGAAETDAEVPKPEWLNVPKFPQASFESTAIKALGGGRFEVAGKLSIKGRTQNVVVPVSVVQSGATSTATGTFTIQRLAFKVGEGDWADTQLVANDVAVRFKLLLAGMPPL